MKYRVLIEAKIREEVEVDAETYEEAVDKVTAMNIEKADMLRPTWVDTAEQVEATGELAHEVIGPCGWCKKTMVNREIPDQPWVYGGDPHNEHGDLVCYSCLKKDSLEAK